ncbi:MAG: DUF1634 domain-containing protein [Phycisphaerales bacterium]
MNNPPPTPDAAPSTPAQAVVPREHAMEVRMAMLLTVGTSLALGLAVVGVVLHVVSGERDPINLHVFGAGVGSGFRSVRVVFQRAIAGDAMGIMQLSALALIATPFARVLFALVAFAIKKDRLYTLVAAIVLLGLALGLTGLVE